MTSTSWVTLKRVHDALAKSAVNAFQAGQPRALTGLFAIKVENGAPVSFEPADNEVAQGLRFGEPGLDGRIRELFVERSAGGGRLRDLVGFVPDVVVLATEITYVPSTGGAPPEQRLLISVHTPTASFPVAHPILEGPPRRCDLRPFPEKSCSLEHFMESDDPAPSAPKPPKELEVDSLYQHKLGEETFAAVLAATADAWRDACLTLRLEGAQRSVTSTLSVTLESGKVIPIPVSGPLKQAVHQLIAHRAPQAEPWCRMRLTLSPDGKCVGKFDYGEECAA